MKFKQVDNVFVLKVEKGELVHEQLVAFCTERNIHNATISGIGAVEHVTCGYYDLPNKDYLFKEYDEIVEVASYNGNIIIKEDGLFVHAHGTFSNRDNQVFGGHVNEMRVGVVMEIILTPLSSSIKRTHDETIGLYLMDI